MPRPLPANQLRKTDPAVIQELDGLLDEHTDGEAARILNERGRRPGVADAFDRHIVCHLRRDHGLADHSTRLRKQGLLTVGETASLLAATTNTVKLWRLAGLLEGRPRNDRPGEYLYEPLRGDVPMKWKTVRRATTSLECAGRSAV